MTNRFALIKPVDAAADGTGNHCRREFTQIGYQMIAFFIKLTDYNRSFINRPVIQLTGNLILDHTALFFNYQNFFQPFGELMGRNRFQRPIHTDFQNPDADFTSDGAVNSQIVQRFHHIKPGLAGSDNSQPRAGCVESDSIKPIGIGKCPGRVNPVSVEQSLLLKRCAWPLCIQPPFRYLYSMGNYYIDPIRAEVRRDGGVHVLRDRFQSDPAAAESRHGPADQAIIKHILNIGRIQYRYRSPDKHVFALMGYGRGFAGVVVSGDGQYPAVFCRAEQIGMFDRIHAAVHSGALAIPHRKYAIIPGSGQKMGLLGAPDGSGREVLVYTGLEMNVMFIQPRLRLPQRLIQRSKRRPAIPGYETGRIQPLFKVPLMLQQGQPNQRFNPRHECTGVIQIVLVFQGNLI